MQMAAERDFPIALDHYISQCTSFDDKRVQARLLNFQKKVPTCINRICAILQPRVDRT